MRFAKLCVLEIGKNAGRVELVRFVGGQIPGGGRVFWQVCAVVLNAAIDEGGFVRGELLRNGAAAEHHGRRVCDRVIPADETVRVISHGVVVSQTVAIRERSTVLEIVGEENGGRTVRAGCFVFLPAFDGERLKICDSCNIRPIIRCSENWSYRFWIAWCYSFGSSSSSSRSNSSSSPQFGQTVEPSSSICSSMVISSPQVGHFTS